MELWFIYWLIDLCSLVKFIGVLGGVIFIILAIIRDNINILWISRKKLIAIGIILLIIGAITPSKDTIKMGLIDEYIDIVEVE